ncbi:MAG: hypothetical protein NTY90_00575 [Candidatus Micrarchaeota archaeon]|nr:hypothetical protein [Candidatus Micrarchaeota archaeon]
MATKTREQLLRQLKCDELAFIEKKCKQDHDEKCVEAAEREKQEKKCRSVPKT